MSKSPDAFRTISEVSEWLETPAHVLRFWESRFPQIKPLKRAGGRRYYRPADMQLLGGIKKLLHEDGITIRGVQKILREKGVKHVCSFSPGLLDGEVIDQPAEAEARVIAPKPARRVASVTPLRPRKSETAADPQRPVEARDDVEDVPESPMAEDLPHLPPRRQDSVPASLSGFEGDTPDFLAAPPPSTPDGFHEAPSENLPRDNYSAPADSDVTAAEAEDLPQENAGSTSLPEVSPPEEDHGAEAEAQSSPQQSTPQPPAAAATAGDSSDTVPASGAASEGLPDIRIPHETVADDPADDDISVTGRPLTALLRPPAAGRVAMQDQSRAQLVVLAGRLLDLRERVGNDNHV